mgnify:CR=1 FL=1
MPKTILPTAQQLTERGTLEYTLSVLMKHFKLSAQGYCCQTRDLWRVLILAAVRRSYIETTCNDLQDAPDSNTVRGYLKEQLTENQIRTLQHDFNRALASQLPSWLRERPQEVAIDLHDDPYYGKDDPKWMCRGEARAGTTRFFRCATAYVMRQHQRFTLAVEFVHPDDDLATIVKRLRRRVKALQIAVKRYYFDKGFCSIPVLRSLLRDPQLSAIIAVPIRGKTGGTRALCRGRKSYRTTHTFRSDQWGELTVPVAVVRTIRKLRDGRRKATWLVYVLIHADDVPIARVRKMYRRRFGIESSYRLLEQVCGKTTAHNPALRFLWMGLALLLGNIWIALQWCHLQCLGSGPRRVLRSYFILDRMVQFIRRAVEAIYGVISMVCHPALRLAKL